MKTANLLAVLMAVFFSLPAFAQLSLVTCSSERNPDKSISIYADSRNYGDYTVKLTFTTLEGYETSFNTETALVTVQKGKRQVAKLTLMRSAANYAMNYRYQYYPGIALRNPPDSSFIYLMPGAEHIDLRVYKGGSLAKMIGQESTDNFVGTGFIYKLGDTVCAARGGIVLTCNDDVKEGEKEGQAYNKERNKILIEHKDGTLAHYTFVSPMRLLVTAGDEVIPGQPLAVFDKESERYHVLFAVDYLDEKKAVINYLKRADEKAPSFYRYLPTIFYVSETTKPMALEPRKQYSVFHPKEIVAAELSKKEKKKLGL